MQGLTFLLPFLTLGQQKPDKLDLQCKSTEPENLSVAHR